MAEIENSVGGFDSGGDGGGGGRLGCSGLSSSAVEGVDRVFPGWGIVSGVVEESFGVNSSVVMGGISGVVLVMWILGGG